MERHDASRPPRPGERLVVGGLATVIPEQPEGFPKLEPTYARWWWLRVRLEGRTWEIAVRWIDRANAPAWGRAPETEWKEIEAAPSHLTTYAASSRPAVAVDASEPNRLDRQHGLPHAPDRSRIGWVIAQIGVTIVAVIGTAIGAVVGWGIGWGIGGVIGGLIGGVLGAGFGAGIAAAIGAVISWVIWLIGDRIARARGRTGTRR